MSKRDRRRRRRRCVRDRKLTNYPPFVRVEFDLLVVETSKSYLIEIDLVEIWVSKTYADLVNDGVLLVDRRIAQKKRLGPFRRPAIWRRKLLEYVGSDCAQRSELERGFWKWSREIKWIHAVKIPLYELDDYIVEYLDIDPLTTKYTRREPPPIRR